MWEIISNYLSTVLIISSVFIFGIIVLNSSKNYLTKRSVVLFHLICILQILAFTNTEGTLKTLIMLLINVLFFKYEFDVSFSKSIVMSLLCMLLFIVPDMLEILFITKVLGYSNEFCYNIFANSLLSNSIIFVSTLVLTLLFRKILRRIINIKLEDNTKLLIYSALTLICILIFFYKAFLDITINLNFIVSIFVMITFLVIFISLIKQTLDNNKLTKEYDSLLEFMTTYENEIEKQRILRHETKNEFLTIRAKICDNQENEEIVNYIDELLQEKIKVKQEEYAKFGYLPPNGIKGLCYFKVQEAEEKGIKVALNISKRIKNSAVYKLNTKEQKEFGRILGVLLDNAIESSLESKEKQLGIEAYINLDEEFQMIISNTYINKIDKDKVGKERFSTKGKNRGHGLLLVKHIVNENKLFELKTNINNNIYTQTIKIKKA